MLEPQLLNGLKAGQNWAFEEAYKNSFSSILRLVTTNSGTFHDAQDLMQDTIFAVVKNSRKKDFNLTCKLSVYIYSVGRKLWLMKLRKKNINVVNLNSKDYLFIAIDDKLIEQKKEREQKYNIVAQLLEEMGDKCKKIIYEFYYKNTSLEQIAVLTNLAPASVKVTKHRCMKTLKQKVRMSKKIISL